MLPQSIIVDTISYCLALLDFFCDTLYKNAYFRYDLRSWCSDLKVVARIQTRQDRITFSKTGQGEGEKEGEMFKAGDRRVQGDSRDIHSLVNSLDFVTFSLPWFPFWTCPTPISLVRLIQRICSPFSVLLCLSFLFLIVSCQQTQKVDPRSPFCLVALCHLVIRY